ncbi:HlyD family secretion protein [Neiella sp. HB171785]|uniref:HlyD family secretion protein n=1 Tax=Neiella litorisoli TaxID=2771431 RepID=A0A8J6QGR2_9GAMM|nr:HlyD family secretion protein [Neiella litorisoli]MBD1389135.1 HlyD family secretion protein [Neiella litorisoli]
MKSKLITLALVALAIIAVVLKYQTYVTHPWTRDALVRANIIEVTPRVTGPITKIYVADNTMVTAGQLLFEIDDRIYLAAYEKAQATLAQAEVQVQRARNELQRMTALEKKTPGAVPVITLNNLTDDVDAAVANVAAAAAGVENAKLDLEFTKVYASKDGYITNFNVAEGAHVVANQPVVALIDSDSFWIEGFFQETDLEHVHAGDTASITLMSYPDQPLQGKVVSLGYGIAQTDGATSQQMLPTVNPNFEWIRLAQRIPVKIKVQILPEQVELRVGTTASVMITPQARG